MNMLINTTPASMRKPVQHSRFVEMLRTRASRTVTGLIPEGQVTMRSAFERLPHEPEDARMTGVTRSLERRLLALNLNVRKELAQRD